MSDQQAAAAKPAAIIDDVRSIIAKSLNISADQLTPETYLDELGEPDGEEGPDGFGQSGEL